MNDEIVFLEKKKTKKVAKVRSRSARRIEKAGEPMRRREKNLGLASIASVNARGQVGIGRGSKD